MRITHNDRKFLRAMMINAEVESTLDWNDSMRLLDDQIGATAKAEEDRARWRRKYLRLRESVVWLCAMVGWWPR